ncbi:MAG: DUF3465 domain-containing protein [Woeseiaceae bacterium]
MKKSKQASWAAVISAIVAALFTVLFGSNDSAVVTDEDWSRSQDNAWVVFEGTVYKLLPDDNKGSRHQRFLVRSQGGQSLLIAHNIDLADYAPVSEGSEVLIRGQFEWTEKGGVVHWTHHDPQGRREGGYITVNGQTIR